MGLSGSTEPVTRWELDSLKQDFDEKLRRLKSDLNLERSERLLKGFAAVWMFGLVVLMTVLITLRVAQ